MKLALYRKYRPRTFEDVVGQENVTAALKNQIAAGRVGHAYLFTGVRGTGKTTLAKILAKAVNCPNCVNGSPCGKCDICRGIDNGSILDVTEIDAASNNKVDDVRDILEETNYTPAVCSKRVYIVDEVHMLTMQAFNALLKTLEEPPEHVMFILATTEDQKVPATILSRCQRFDLKRMPEEKIAARLKFVCEQENIEITDDAAALIARLADGALRDALSILDTSASLGGKVDEDTVKRLTGVTDRQYLFDLAAEIKSGDFTKVLGTVSGLYENSMDTVRIASELTRHYRNLLMVKVGNAVLNDCSAAVQKQYSEVSRDYSDRELLYSLSRLADAADKMTRSLDREITLELALLELAGGAPAQAPFQQVANRAAASLRSEPAKAEAQPKNETPAPLPVDENPVSADNTGSGDTLSQWPEVLDVIKSKNRMLGTLLTNSVAHMTGTHLLIEANEMGIKFIRENAEARPLIKEAVAQITGMSLPIGPWKGTVKKENKTDDGFETFLKNAEQAGVEIERR